MIEPFAVQVYRRFQQGESISAISEESGIPEDRITRRILAAVLYLSTGSGRNRGMEEALTVARSDVRRPN